MASKGHCSDVVVRSERGMVYFWHAGYALCDETCLGRVGGHLYSPILYAAHGTTVGCFLSERGVQSVLHEDAGQLSALDV